MLTGQVIDVQESDIIKKMVNSVILKLFHIEHREDIHKMFEEQNSLELRIYSKATSKKSTQRISTKILYQVD